MRKSNRADIAPVQSGAVSAAMVCSIARSAFKTLSITIGLATASILISRAAMAQTAPPPPTTVSQGIQEITVTATRLQASGFDAPTPTTTISIQDIENRGFTNVADYLNEIPAFVATDTPTARSFFPGLAGINALDLRGLGANRTLVLVDGQRETPTTDTGEVNLNTIPQVLIKNIEVVTGGASADWGSDAIAGVVNILLDDQFDGLRTSTQYGESTKHDAGSTYASIAYGSSVGDGAGHFVIAAEYQKDNGLPSQTDRAIGRQGWAFVPNPAYTGAPGVPANLIVENAGSIFQQGGVVLYPGPIAGTTFGPGGTVGTLNTGQYVTSDGQTIVGGAGTLFDSQLVPSVERKNLMVLFHRDLAADIQLYFRASYAGSSADANIVSPFALPVTIQSDNAFIPPAFKSVLNANGLTSFDLFRGDSDFGFIHTTQLDTSYSVTLGLKGKLGSKWTWDVYAKDGDVEDNLDERNLLTQNFSYASDAIRSPTGQIVCRATLQGNPSANGCVPINLFGLDSPSAAAINYVMGTGFQDTDLQEQSESAILRGELFNEWAGPVNVALGAEHREDHIKTAVDPNDQEGNFLISDFQPIEGQINVKEFFVETGVPLLSDLPFAKSLDFNAAARSTDYSISGRVTTWKAGLTFAPIEDIKLRGSVSRDIRAPNVAELFMGPQTGFLNLVDPFTKTSPLISVLTSGNTDLKPEIATTTTFGIVLQPSVLPGMRASVDAYDIKLRGQINTVNPQVALDQCYAGATAQCAYFTRNAAGQLVEAATPYANIGTSEFSGIDFEFDYRKALQEWVPSAVGALSFRMFANFVDKIDIGINGEGTVNYVGSLAPDANNPQVPSLPKWRWNGSVSYDVGQLTVTTSARIIGSGHYASYFTSADLSNQQNSVGSVTYINASANYALDVGKAKVDLFLGINNAFDRVAPALPYAFISQQPNTGILYDVIGRYVYGGFRVKL